LLSAWARKKPLELLFPNATFVVGAKAWQRANHPHTRDKASFIPALQVLLQQSGRLEIVAGDVSQTLGPAYRFHLSDGHTPGMMLTEIPGSLGPVLFAADLIPGRPWVHRSITMGYDRFP
jgi:glyoxylase-like metal-dependent hydrolase (beta-lactamase superfamily II)